MAKPGSGPKEPTEPPAPAPPSPKTTGLREGFEVAKDAIESFGLLGLIILTVIRPEARALASEGKDALMWQVKKATQHAEDLFQRVGQRVLLLFAALFICAFIVVSNGALIQDSGQRWRHNGVFLSVFFVIAWWLWASINSQLFRLAIYLGIASEADKGEFLKSGLVDWWSIFRVVFSGVRTGAMGALKLIGQSAQIIGRTMFFLVAYTLYFSLPSFWRVPALIWFTPFLVIGLFTGLMFWKAPDRSSGVRTIIWILVVIIAVLPLYAEWGGLIQPWLEMKPTDTYQNIGWHVGDQKVTRDYVIMKLIMTVVVVALVMFAIRKANGSGSTGDTANQAGSSNTHPRRSATSAIFLLPVLLIIFLAGLLLVSLYIDSDGWSHVTSLYVNHKIGMFSDPNIRNGVGGIPPSLPTPRVHAGSSGVAHAATAPANDQIVTLPAKSGWQTIDVTFKPGTVVNFRVVDDTYQVRLSGEEWMDASCAGYVDQQSGQPVIPADNPDQTIASGCPAARLPGFSLLVRNRESDPPRFCGSGTEVRVANKQLQFALNVPTGPGEDANYRGDIRVVMHAVR